jgi:tetratricopeptide (TPR) repeat protein
VRPTQGNSALAPAWPALIVCLTLAAFAPVLSNAFIDWDDQSNFVTNPWYRGLGWTQLTWMATTFHRGVYQPLAWLFAAIEFRFGGADPWVYHAGSWLLHAIAAALLYPLARRLFARLAPDRPGAVGVAATAAALLWAAHPLRVEAVAWASAQGYPLAAVFALGSILAWLRWREQGDGSTGAPLAWYAASVALAVCAYLAKPVAVTLPAVIVLLDWYRSRDDARWPTRRAWMPLLPYALPAVLVAAAAPLARARLGTSASSQYDVVDRVAQACYAAAYYAVKTVLPFGLTVFTPLPQPFDPFEPRFVGAALGLVAAGALIAWARTRAKGLAACALGYLVLLAPVLGFVRQGDQLVADRYSYFAGAPLALALGGGLLLLMARGARPRAIALAGLAAAMILALGALSWQLAHAWRNPGTLWAHAVSVDPASHRARINLGLAHLTQGSFEAALREFDAAISLNPRSSNAHFNRGLTLARWSRTDEAIASYQLGLALDPADATARAHLGDLLASLSRWPEAEAEYREAARLAPRANVYNSLGITLAQQARFAEAIAAFRDALAIDPTHDDARANLETALQARPGR